MSDAGGAGRADEGVAPGPQTPRTVIEGRYELLESIGSGAMGEVWRAYDRRLRRYVAVKGLLARTAMTADTRRTAMQRARREAEALAKIEHQNVVTVHDQVETDHQVWIVMKLLEGRSLADLLRRERVLGVPRAAGIGLQILQGLRAVHQARVLHRDVKPGNVLVRDEGLAILVDFGIASFAGANKVTKLGIPIGTPPYMAPELFAPASPGPTPASDLWALGVTLYEMAEGRLPFRGHEVWEVQENIRSSPEPPYRYSGPLAPVIQGLLAPDKDDRLDAATAEAMLQEVLRDPEAQEPLKWERPTESHEPPFAQQSHAHESGQEQVPPEKLQPARQGRRGGPRGWRGALAVALAALLAGGVWLALPDREPESPPGNASEAKPPSPAQKEWERWRKGHSTLRIGVKGDQPGLSEYLEKKKTYEGFDISMAYAIAEALGYPRDGVEFIRVTSDNRSTRLVNKEVDLVVASYSITEERRKVDKVEFVGPYFNAGRTFLVRKKSRKHDLDSAADVRESKAAVCTAKGSTYESLADDGYTMREPQLATYQECVDELLNADSDVYAVASDDVLLAGYAHGKPGELKLLDTHRGTEGYGVAMRPQDEALRSQVCSALREVISSGDWDTMYDKHLADLGLLAKSAPDPPECGTL
ncbi:serine/threonine-protein kinase [Streptomyces koyangensis]|uniref:serine/threonine-protein kinase n=1 Tax=Streptomyces koyangensis TaxID=188770 RepID=UPI003C2BE971